MPGPYRLAPLAAAHDRQGFACGVVALDRYFREQVTQDIRRRVTACFVATPADDPGQVAGFYTLAAGSLLLTDLPDNLVKRLPRYPLVPVARLGRLAVAAAHRGQGLGAALLWDAARRAARAEVSVFALAVDAKDEAAVTFYRHHGFVAFGSLPRQLLLPLARFAPPA